MPVAIVNLIEGRSVEKKKAMIIAVTKAISESLDAPVESIRVIIQEVPSTDWGIAGKTAKDMGR
ncbi:MAG: 2-hydroxymuconate tautomerase [Phenylobacterium sp.]|uniref:2-hydroxymuconate tautomerase n=1 Tax=Phenylobacterium sp. TaxID=1871053 RepID=UPI002733BF27|nr:2-hydroxymuconate tautomerase [Phenylobacterium sp.]MDP3173369.1 2-hydroxymuconate tautomerase [Phenylobacterium sp.]